MHPKSEDYTVSTKIVAETNNYLAGVSASLFAVPKNHLETPSDYVRRIIKEKGLSHVKVAQRARQLGGELSPGTVNSIIQGHVKSPGVDMIPNLALGLGEPEDDVDRILRGKTLADDSRFQKSFYALLWYEASQLTDEKDKAEVKVLAENLMRDIQRRTLKT